MANEPGSNTGGGSNTSGNTGYNWSGYAYYQEHGGQSVDNLEWVEETRSSTKSCKLKINYYVDGANGLNASNPPSSDIRSYTGTSKSVTLNIKAASGDSMTNDGYRFLGWATSQGSSTVAYNPGDVISHSWNKSQRGTTIVSLYAVWTDSNIITYHPDSNSDETDVIYQEKTSGSSATLKGETFHRTGYTQSGWATESGGEQAYALGGSYSSDDALGLYPVWTANTYTISLNANDGSDPAEEVDISVTFGQEVTIPSCPFIRSGYSFSSWNESATGDDTRWKTGTYTVDRAEDITLYVIWKGNEYTVTCNSNYPFGMVNSTSSSTAVFGEYFATKRNLFVVEGATFTGLNTAANGSGTDLIPSGISMDTFTFTEDGIWNIPNDVTVYAQWDLNKRPCGRIFFNGKTSDQYGVVVEEFPTYQYAERPFNHKTVNGRNGDILLDPERYENVKKTYKIACYDPSKSFFESSLALSQWLHSGVSDYIRLEDSYEPSVYRKAVYEETNEVENVFAKAGKCTISFNCMPQRFLIVGDMPVSVTNGDTIVNPTHFDSKPLIEVSGTGTLNVNGRSVVISTNQNDLIIDCETCNVYDLSGLYCNYYIYCDEFPVLSPGGNVITFDDTITSVEIKPRWWML